MGFKLTSNDFVDYLIATQKIIMKNKKYITELDALTGDGDHWINMHSGFVKIIEQEDKLRRMNISEIFRTVGMTMMSTIGGSSGALYGSGYIAASKEIKDIQFLECGTLYKALESMLHAIMKRGKTEPGEKTMVDPLFEALKNYKNAIDNKLSEEKTIQLFIDGAKNGAHQTKDMAAIKGRASYRLDKGIGFLDPGAITMAMQLECLGNYVIKKLQGETNEESTIL